MVTASGLDRRALCLTACGVGLAGLLPPPAVATTRRQRSALERYLLVRGALDGKLVIASLDGVYHAVVDGRTTPLVGLQSVSYSLFDRLADGTFRHRLAEVEYYTDLTSGKIIYDWVNPLTQEKLKLTDRGRTVSEFVIHPDLSVTLGKSGSFRQSVTSVREQGDDLWYEEQLTYAPATGEPGLPSTEFVTYHARKADLASADHSRVPAELSYTVLSAWRPWMQMGRLAGSVLLRGRGLAKVTPGQLPRQWVDRTRVYWPELIDAPERLLRA